ncbi:MAG: ABC transporter ATP-binding protein, partial [Candidatus Microthrix parvicella]
MLIKLLRNHLGPFKWLLVGIVFFQFLQTLGTLFLPTLNADIIDKGIANQDTPYIWRMGGVMLVITLFQV